MCLCECLGVEERHRASKREAKKTKAVRAAAAVAAAAAAGAAAAAAAVAAKRPSHWPKTLRRIPFPVQNLLVET